jgi:serine/threonine protein kinase
MSALQQLQHPNIVSLMDIATDGPCFYLIQELCSTDLAVLLQNANRLVPQPVVKALMQQLLAALAACHARGIMHRDIKPSNILITSHGTLKLGDFGQARSFICGAELRQPDCVQQRLSSYVMMPQQHQAPLNKQPPIQDEQQHLQRKLQHMTEGPADPNPGGTHNSCIDSNACNTAGGFTAAQGSRWYRAPELLYHSSSYGPEVDIWAAGMVLAEVLGLCPLLPGQSDIDQLALMQQVLGSITLQDWPEACQLPDWHKISFGFSPTQPLCQLLPDAPEAALDLLQQLLWYRPDERITAAEAVQHTWFTSHPPPASADDVAVYVQAVLQQPWPRLPSQDV